MKGRKPKKGLDWFKKDVNYYEDFKIIDLINEYGPVGNTIFDCILCMIYREGYYLEISPDKLAFLVMRVIGNRWVKEKSFVLRVIYYCSDIGLLDKDLLEQNVITSVGIQVRYAEVTSRNKVDKSLYWLIDENGQSLKNAPKIPISVTENLISVTTNPISATEMQQEERSKKKEVRNKRESGAVAPTPTLVEIKSFCLENGLRIDPERFFNYYKGNGWVTSNGQPVVDWQSIAHNWNKTEKGKSESKRDTTYDLAELENLNVFDLEN